MKYAKIFLCSVALLCASVLSAQQLPKNTELVAAQSASMQREIPALVVLPDSYAKNADKRYPVIYLLHGFGGNHTTWLLIKPDLPRLASLYGVIFVCPDGSTSWYWDAPKNPKFRYETFVSKELVEFVDSKYRTIASPKGRAVSGFSMGGHGGLWLGIRHQDVFGACGSSSGGVDIRPFPAAWKMFESLGEYADNAEIWDSHTVINQLHKINPRNAPAIVIDCSTSDFFYEVNETLHKKMLYMRIPHQYTTRPGAHNRQYWRNSVEYQTLFFAKFFENNAKQKK